MVEDHPLYKKKLKTNQYSWPITKRLLEENGLFTPNDKEARWINFVVIDKVKNQDELKISCFNSRGSYDQFDYPEITLANLQNIKNMPNQEQKLEEGQFEERGQPMVDDIPREEEVAPEPEPIEIGDYALFSRPEVGMEYLFIVTAIEPARGDRRMGYNGVVLNGQRKAETCSNTRPFVTKFRGRVTLQQ